MKEAVDLYNLLEVQRGSGALQIPRSRFNELISDLYDNNPEKLRKAWYDSGHWYGQFLRTKLGEEESLKFLEKALLVSWNLDEVEVKHSDLAVHLRLASFVMSRECTELLVFYISGVMESLGYEIVVNDYLRGLANLGYRKIHNR